ncbi:hypothetical protein B0H11DRAFT_2244042 [Mycena galericulata]|nr:hypothetical protein B0H11DRAFT_2244042 [Mycena galericulata]
MPQPRTDDIMSDSDDSDENPAPPPPDIKPRAPRRSRDDLSGNVQLPNRTRGAAQRQPSQKQAQKEKENYDTAKQQIIRLQKDLAKSQQQLKQASKSSAANDKASDDGPESEEQQDSDTGGIQFQSSIRPLGELPVEPPRPTVIYRKVSKSTAPKTSSRAFLKLPEVPAPTSGQDTASPPSPSWTPEDNMDHDGDPFAEDPRHNDWVGDRDHDVPRSSSPSRSGGHTDRPGCDGHRASPRGSSTSRPSDRERGRPAASTPYKRPRQSSPSAPAPPAKRPRKEPQFAQGYVTTGGVKPKVADYEPVVRALLIRAMAEYAVFILTKKAFPDAGLQTKWAGQTFKNSCRASNQHYKLTERMGKLITKRGSHVRGQIITAMRTLFAAHYKFNRSGTPAAIQSNIKLSAFLLDEASFGYKDVSARTGYGGNKILDECRHLVLFKDKTSLGAIFASHFNPYPCQTVAVEFLALEHCAQEWSTGRFVAAQFSEKSMLASYTDHVNDIQKWAAFNVNAVTNIRIRWYERASRALGLATTSKGDTNISFNREAALRDELDGRTGATDSEADEADEPDDPGEPKEAAVPADPVVEQ